MKKRSRILSLVLAGALLAVSLYVILNREEPAEQVKTVTVGPAIVSETVGAAGVIKEALFGGYYYNVPVKVGKILVKPGDVVREGEPMIEVDLEATSLNVKLMAAGLINYSGTGEETAVEAASILQMNNRTGKELLQELEKVPAVITANFDCVIGKINYEEGAYSAPYNPLLTVCDTSAYYAVVKVDEKFAGRITPGQNAVVSGAAFDGEYRAVVTEVSPRATLTGSEESGNKVEVRLEIKDVDGEAVKPNYSVIATIFTGYGEDELFVPYDCISFTDSGEYVFVEEQGRAVKRKISIIRAMTGGVTVAEGISFGDKVICRPPSSLMDGDLVKE